MELFCSIDFIHFFHLDIQRISEMVAKRDKMMTNTVLLKKFSINFIQLLIAIAFKIQSEDE